MRSLAGHCFDLRFYKPRIEQVRAALMTICFKEKIKVTKLVFYR
jgi:replication factor C subunit 1